MEEKSKIEDYDLIYYINLYDLTKNLKINRKLKKDFKLLLEKEKHFKKVQNNIDNINEIIKKNNKFINFFQFIYNLKKLIWVINFILFKKKNIYFNLIKRNFNHFKLKLNFSLSSINKINYILNKLCNIIELNNNKSISNSFYLIMNTKINLKLKSKIFIMNNKINNLIKINNILIITKNNNNKYHKWIKILLNLKNYNLKLKKEIDLNELYFNNLIEFVKNNLNKFNIK